MLQGSQRTLAVSRRFAREQYKRSEAFASSVFYGPLPVPRVADALESPNRFQSKYKVSLSLARRY
jgi:hypothetical protein